MIFPKARQSVLLPTSQYCPPRPVNLSHQETVKPWDIQKNKSKMWCDVSVILITMSRHYFRTFHAFTLSSLTKSLGGRHCCQIHFAGEGLEAWGY